MFVLITMFLPLSSFEQSVLSFELKILSSAFWDIYNEVKWIGSLRMYSVSGVFALLTSLCVGSYTLASRMWCA